MLNDLAKAKVVSALQPLYVDEDFSNMDGDFVVTVTTSVVPTTPPPVDTETVDIPKA